MKLEFVGIFTFTGTVAVGIAGSLSAHDDNQSVGIRLQQQTIGVHACDKGCVQEQRRAFLSVLSRQKQYEHGFVAGYMQAYIEWCGNFDTIVPPIPKPNEGATSYADGYAAGKSQGQKDGEENCPEEDD